MELSQSIINYLNGIKSPNAHRILSSTYAIIGETAQALDHLNQAIPILRQYGIYAHFVDNQYLESIADNKDYIEIIEQIKEEMRIIREQVFAMEAAGEL